MTIELRGGPEQLARVSRQVRAEANGGLEREMNKELRQAAKPFKREVQRTAMRLPTRGGLDRKVAAARLSVRNRAARGQGVQLVLGARRSQTRQINDGFVFHPVFGGKVQVRQVVPAGFADDAAEASQAEVHRGMQAAAARSADRIERAGRGL